MTDDAIASVSMPLARHVRQAIEAAGGWLPFDRYMSMALYTPQLGYYAHAGRKFGAMPSSGSDFVTAPELTHWFGATLARQFDEALDATGTDEVWEFGAGSGALAEQLLQALGPRLRCYTIVELSSALRERQQARLAPFGHQVRWLHALPAQMQGLLVGNEVLDAMPVQLLHWDGLRWHERGVAWHDGHGHGGGDGDGFVFADRPTALHPPHDGPFVPGTVTEIHPQAEAFIATLAERLTRGSAFFIDYGFPAAEYYHPQRIGGTLMCHQGHRADGNPLADIGLKDITAHVNFTGIALAGQDAGLDVLGYTTQANFLLNCGLADMLTEGTVDARARAPAHMLLGEHEMGELFKVIAFGRGATFDPVGFARGDRSHTL